VYHIECDALPGQGRSCCGLARATPRLLLAVASSTSTEIIYQSEVESVTARRADNFVQVARSEYITSFLRGHSPYTKGNFEFERVVTGWRGIHTVLDCHLKK